MEATPSTCRSDAMVENLPPEVRHELLTTLDLSSLRDMVHASPIYYRQRTVLDAYWVYQTTRSSKFPNITSAETISNFGQAYAHQRASSSYSILKKSVTENLAVGIAAFHYSTVDPILQLYIQHALGVLAQETGSIVNQEPLSEVEQARVIRGLYRFQLCCNLFTMANFPESSTLSMSGRPMRILVDYIRLLEPWEIEEIGCVYSFAVEQFQRVCDTVQPCAAGYGAETRPRRCPASRDFYDMGNTTISTAIVRSTISQGLPILHTVLAGDGKYLANLVRCSVVWLGGGFLEDVIMSKPAQQMRHRDDVAAGDNESSQRDHMPFLGDSEVSPPLAWTLLWKESHSKLYGHFIPDEMRRWAYVMWDAARLERVGAARLLESQWKETWGGHDPRDDMPGWVSGLRLVIRSTEYEPMG